MLHLRGRSHDCLAFYVRRGQGANACPFGLLLPDILVLVCHSWIPPRASFTPFVTDDASSWVALCALLAASSNKHGVKHES